MGHFLGVHMARYHQSKASIGNDLEYPQRQENLCNVPAEEINQKSCRMYLPYLFSQRLGFHHYTSGHSAKI